MHFDVITTIPERIQCYAHTSIIGRGQERGVIDIRLTDPRDFASDKRRTVDDTPFGGGAGMVLMAEPILKAVESVKRIKKTKVILFSAKGRQFNQRMAIELAKKYQQLILICGRYEGVDERVKTILRADEISVGPYILTDGDVPAMTVISAVSRLIPGVIRLESLAEESHWNLLLKKEAATKHGLEYPHYTRPDIIKYRGKEYRVPRVLLSGNHKKISEWRAKKSK